MIGIKKIENGFAGYYYLNEDGSVFNRETNSFVELKRNSYSLRDSTGKLQRITLKKLYFLVFDKVFCRDTIPDLDGEVWKEIPDSGGNYLCSDKGRVKSYVGYEAILLKPSCETGYPRVYLWLADGKRYDFLVHKLVAMLFLDPPERADYQIHHKDFCPAHNEKENLVYLSPVEHKKIHTDKKVKKNELS